MTCSTDADALRRADAVVTVRSADGSPCPGTDVLVEQVRHGFSFGNIGFDFVGPANGEHGEGRENVFGGADPEAAGALEALWLDLFTTATLPFYWAGFEPVQGEPDTRRLRAAAAWFRERGVTVKGHPLVWHTLTPDWLREHSDEDVETIVRARVRREAASFAGLVDTWDAINEVVIMPVFANEDRQNAVSRLCRRIGRIPTIRLAFEEARDANSAATLVLNDFDLSTAYECLIEGVLEAGIRIDAIGLQSHMHRGYWGEERTQEVLERFARYGLPLHWTETTLVSGDLMPAEIEDLNDHRVGEWPSTPEGEERQAVDVVRHYRTLLAHPAVEAVTYWGMTDQGAWLGAPAGLVRSDGTPKPAYDALHGLVKGEWWLPPTRLRTDADGRVAVRGWAGEYTVSAGNASGAFVLRPDRTPPEVTVA
ncbi:endo-1,4-beta-xylanase [Blastococcus goldschmidtiae]|uniref:Beta-xylanase n=1 Tax=Blastococcus goldschmidtiae TaxID=3075546 RepID=A0ABU2KAA0_9ACTN|nr:endo-1,4-beta-xylanase [Blastococcus sp. DSM 46792]MDT0277121.1 endo-1,4-beta-xylanase [Blastococcus sp. DSM 46792]